jgi:hypothetical protein
LVSQFAGDDVGAHEFARGDDVGCLPVDGEVACEPVGLAGNVVVDVLEAERFEPARGSWA